MSTSRLHYHFRAQMALRPVQFQKRLQLNEARQLMVMERKDATTAAFEVGSESPSQFSRDYCRLFGHRHHAISRDCLKVTGVNL